MYWLKLFGGDKGKRALKERILDNRSALVDVMGRNIKDARQCDGLMGQKCIGQFCEKFQKFNGKNGQGKLIEFWRCVHVQTPLLIIESNDLLRSLIVEQRKTQELLIAMHEKKGD